MPEVRVTKMVIVDTIADVMVEGISLVEELGWVGATLLLIVVEVEEAVTTDEVEDGQGVEVEV